MLTPNNIAGLVSVASIFPACLLAIPQVALLKKQPLAWLLSIVFVLTLIPINTLSLSAYLRGFTGDLSITTMLVLCRVLASPWLENFKFAKNHRLIFLGLIATAALCLYPMSLGMSSYDPYRLGYGNGIFLFGIFVLAIILWFEGVYFIVIGLSIAILAWTAGWYESNNLWDYLVDPFISIYALGAGLIQGVRMSSRSR